MSRPNNSPVAVLGWSQIQQPLQIRLARALCREYNTRCLCELRLESTCSRMRGLADVAIDMTLGKPLHSMSHPGPEPTEQERLQYVIGEMIRDMDKYVLSSSEGVRAIDQVMAAKWALENLYVLFGGGK